MNPPLTVMKMVHIDIIHFYVSLLYSCMMTSPIQIPGKYTVIKDVLLFGITCQRSMMRCVVMQHAQDCRRDMGAGGPPTCRELHWMGSWEAGCGMRSHQLPDWASCRQGSNWATELKLMADKRGFGDYQGAF